MHDQPHPLAGPTPAQVLRDAANAVEQYPRVEALDAITMAAAVLTSTHHAARPLAQDARAALARQLCYAADRDHAADLAAWDKTTPREEIAAAMREAADQAERSVPVRGGPALDPTTEDDYRAEQRDYDGGGA